MGFSLKQKKKELLTAKHPLIDEDASVKIPYLLAIAILMSRVDDQFADAEREALTELAYMLDLPEGQLDRLLARAQQADQQILDEILPSLQTPDVRHAFVLDLYKAAYVDGDFKVEEREFIIDIMEMMQFPVEEAAFLNTYAAAACANDLKSANGAVQKAIEAKLEPNIALLRYFLSTFTYEEELAGFTLGAHESRVITRPAKLTGTVTVNSGAKLTVRDCVLSFQGVAQIIIDGGEVEFANATFTALLDAGGPLIIACSSTPLFEATGCTFDGAGRVQLVASLAGRTSFSNCSFTRAYSKGNRVEKLDPKLTDITGFISLLVTDLANKTDNATQQEPDFVSAPGAAIYSENQLFLANCTFENNFSETYAGAVYAGGQLQMTGGHFKHCCSKGIAGALLVADRYAVSNSSFEECRSEECGGALYICGGDETQKLETSTFTKCAATRSGGAVFIHEAKYSLSQCRFDFCSAGADGGGVATDKLDQQYSFVKQCTFAGCSAKRGGGLFLRCYGPSNYRPDISVTTYTGCQPDSQAIEHRSP